MESATISTYKKPLPPQLVKISKLVKLMDTAFTIPFTNIKFGLDPIIGLFPIVGDLLDYGISAFLLIGMVRNGASGKAVLKMIGNITLDGIVGAIPFLGRFFDVFYKANRRNLAIAVEHFEEGKHQGSALPYLIPILILLAIVVFGIAVATFFAIKFIFAWLATTPLA